MTYVNRRALSAIVRGAATNVSARRLKTWAGFATAWMGLRSMWRVGAAVDDALYPEWEEQEVREPVFIFANGRSGTTMLHRLLGMDEEQFAGFKLYQSMFNVVAVRKALQAIDQSPLAPAGRALVDLINEKVFTGWEGIHEMGIDKEEEDEATFAIALETATVSLLNPFMEGYEELGAVDDLPDDERIAFMDFYEEALKKHLYASGGDKRFLNKNVFFAVRAKAMLERFPDARFLYLVRHPYQALPSWLNMFYEKWRTHSPELPHDSPQARTLAEMSFRYYRAALELIEEMPARNLRVVQYDDLIADPQGVVEGIYEWMGLEMTPAYRARLDAMTERQRRYKSKHTYSLEQFGLTREWVYESCPEVFEHFGFEP